MATYRKATGTVRADGRIIPHAKVFAYEAGTTNEVPIFSDEAGEEPIEQPILTNAAGRFSFFIDVEAYPSFRIYFEKDGIDFDQINEDLDGISLPGSTGPKGDPFQVDEMGDEADLSDFDDEPKGFTYLATDTGNLFIKKSGTSGDWSDPVPFRGPEGPEGEKGDPPAHEWDDTQLRFQNPDESWGDYVDLEGPEGQQGEQGIQGERGLTWQGEWESGTEYDKDDAVEHEGSAWISNADENTGNEPGVAAEWDLLASKGDKGDQGVPGMVWKGEWDSSTAYKVDEVVEHEGSSYICIEEHSNQEPPNETYWELVVEKGDQGEQGVKGDPGLVWEGEWDSETSYQIDDAVSHGGASYVCIAAHSNEEPPNPTYWELLAAKGEKGDQGIPGTPQWEGEWSAGSYKEGEAVYHSDTGSSYVANTDTSNEPPHDDWDLLATKGEKGDKGDTGDPGLIWEGEWGSGTEYSINDVVEHEGSAYVCILSHENQEPPNETYWELLAAKGDKGDTGDIGLDWQGEWQDATSYKETDGVELDGTAYYCIQNHTSDSYKRPGSGVDWESYWDLLAAKGDTGDPFTINTISLLEDRSDYDDESEGFTFLATDTGNVYFKMSDATGDWSDPIPFIRMVWQGEWQDATEYEQSDVVENNGSSYICIQDHTSNADREPGEGVDWEDYWDLVAKAGEEVSGPESSTDSGIALWDGTGGDALKDSSVTIDDDGNVEDVKTISLSDYIDFREIETPSVATGRIFYSDEHDLFAFFDSKGNLIEVGRDVTLKVQNKQGSTIYRGDIVYISGSTGDNPEVRLAKADDFGTSQAVGAVMDESIANNAAGRVAIYGRIRGIDTDAYSEGGELFLSDTTAGEWTNEPSESFPVKIGTVIRSHSSEGSIVLDIDRYTDLSKLIHSDGSVDFEDDQSLGGHGLASVRDITYTESTKLEISGGEITVSQALHTVDTEAEAAEDDLVTINGGTEGLSVRLIAEHPDRTVTLKDGTGNLLLGGDDVELSTDTWVELCYNGTDWVVVGGVGPGMEIHDNDWHDPDFATETALSEHQGETGNEAHVPEAGSAGQFLAHDGTWDTPPDTTYTAGNGLNLSEGEFSADFGDESTQVAPGDHGHVEEDITDLEHDAEKLQGRKIHDSLPSSGDALVWNAEENRWEPSEVSVVGEFTDLLDTPSNYTDHGGKRVVVATDESGLEFIEEVAGYHVEQFTSETEVIIDHNLGEYPVVQVIDDNGIELEAKVTHNTTNQCTINMEETSSGTIVCVIGGARGPKGEDGDVTGPESSINENIVVWDGTDGNSIKDSGSSIDDLATSEELTTHEGTTGNEAHVPSTGTSGQFLAHDGTWDTPPDGDITGPASSVDGNLAVWDGSGGDAIKDGGVKIDDLATASDLSSHEDATGNEAHVPEAGELGEFLAHDGTWATPPDTTYAAGDGLEESPAGTIKAKARAGAAGSRGTVSVHADGLGVDLGSGSTDAAAGNHTHATLYAPKAPEINAQTANYQVVLGDNHKLVTMSHADARTVTIPQNSTVAFPVGALISIARLGGGAVTIVQGTGATLRAPNGLKLKSQYSIAQCWKIATDEWLVYGDLEEA